MPPHNPHSPHLFIAHLFVPEIKDLIREKNFREIKAVLKSISIFDLAESWEEFSHTEHILLFRLLSEKDASQLFQELEPEEQQSLLNSLGSTELEGLLEGIDPEEAVRLFHELPGKTVRYLQRFMEKDQKESVQKLMEFPDNSVGSWIHLQRVELQPGFTSSKALNRIRSSSRFRRGGGSDDYYVTDVRGHVVGAVSLRDLISAPSDTKLSELMKPVRFLKLDPFQDQEDAVRLFSKYKLSSAPVVDNEDRLLGYIISEDMIHLIEEEVTEDFAKMAGTESEELESTSILRTARIRLPWLILTCAGGLVVSWVVNHFNFVLSKVLALAGFMPLIMAMGGNVAAQSSTILVRGIAIGEFDISDKWYLLWREIRVGLILGGFYGSIIGVISYFLFGSTFGVFFSVVVGAGMLISMMVGTMLSVFVPITLIHFGVDPATATGPLITTATDLISVTSFFSLALLLLL